MPEKTQAEMAAEFRRRRSKKRNSETEAKPEKKAEPKKKESGGIGSMLRRLLPGQFAADVLEKATDKIDKKAK